MENPSRRAPRPSNPRAQQSIRRAGSPEAASERLGAPPAGRAAHCGPTSGREGEAGAGRHRPWATSGASGGGTGLWAAAMAEGRSAVRSSVRALKSRLSRAEEPAEVAESRLLGLLERVRAASRRKAEYWVQRCCAWSALCGSGAVRSCPGWRSRAGLRRCSVLCS